VVSGQWSVVSGQWSVVSGQWSLVKGQGDHRDADMVGLAISPFGFGLTETCSTPGTIIDHLNRGAAIVNNDSVFSQFRREMHETIWTVEAIGMLIALRVHCDLHLLAAMPLTGILP
jgi:hypothetical protein